MTNKGNVGAGQIILSGLFRMFQNSKYPLQKSFVSICFPNVDIKRTTR